MAKLMGVALLLATVGLAVGAPYNTKGGPKPGKLNVHIVPHTHDDVGWLKTVDQYYNGQNNTIQHAGVKYILDTVTTSLEQNPDRKFTYVEQAFYQRWWRQQDNATRDMVKGQVKRGQMTFVNGGWCMHDEASTHYLDMIDQTTTGHRLLMEEFGVAPKIGWQLDPFGHSATQAALLSEEMGFVGLFFGRIDYQDNILRKENKSCDFIWRASPSLGPETQIFTGLSGTCGGYGPPTGFNWNVDQTDEPVQDDPQFHDVNTKSRVDDFVNVAQQTAEGFRGEHIMFTMGSDFQYESANNWFSNLDRIIHHVNLDGRVNAFYSSPEIYVAAKATERSIARSLKTDDFFPYASGPHQFWTGYFTSRPAVKRYVRESSAFYQMAKQLVALGGGDITKLEPLAEAMGVLQHHDAVSGTEKQHTAFDYAQRLYAGRHITEGVASSALAKLANESGSLVLCNERNVSICPPSQALGGSVQSMTILVWNAMAQPRTELVEIPLDTTAAKVFDMAGTEQTAQVVPSLPSITQYGKAAGGAQRTLLFNAELPPLGFRAYRVSVAKSTPSVTPVHAPARAAPAVLENEFLLVEFCPNTKKIRKITDKVAKISVKAEQSWMFYNASEGNEESGSPSGAYVFRPNSSEAFPVSQETATLQIVRGALADEAVQTFSSWVSQRVRLAKGARHVEITYTVGPIPIEDGHGKEVISRISTDLQNAGESYTDSNGREMQLRKRDFRPSWDFNATDHGENVSRNYFPVNAAIHMRDQNAQLTVLTDRSQGGSGSVRDGELELMVHRRCLKDDGYGAGEPLNETEFTTPYWNGGKGESTGPGLIIRGQHFLMLSPPEKAAAAWRPQMDRVYLPATPFFAASGAEQTDVLPQYSALAQALPPNVQLVTLEPLADGKLFLRLAHQFGIGEDTVLSKPVTVDIAGLFAGLTVTDVEELGLGGTIPRSEVVNNRIDWKVEGEDHGVINGAEAASSSTSKVSLGPLQIRTFRVAVTGKSQLVGEVHV